MSDNNYPPGVGPWTVLPGEEEGECCTCGAKHALSTGYAKENGDRICGRCSDEEIDEEINERDAATAEVFTTIHVLDDGETWSGDGFVLELTEAQYKRVCEGEHPCDVVPDREGDDYDEDLEDCPMYAPKPAPETIATLASAQYEIGDYLLLSRSGEVLAVSGNSEFDDVDNPPGEPGVIVEVVGSYSCPKSAWNIVLDEKYAAQVTEEQERACRAALYPCQFRWVSVTTPTGLSVQMLVPRAQRGEE